MEQIDISEKPNFVFVDGVLMDREMTQAIHCDPSKSGDCSIPNTVTSVSARVQWMRNTDINHHSRSVKEIGVEAFSDCRSLKSVTIPGSIETLGSDPFYGRHNLSEVRVVGEI